MKWLEHVKPVATSTSASSIRAAATMRGTTPSTSSSSTAVNINIDKNRTLTRRHSDGDQSKRDVNQEFEEAMDESDEEVGLPIDAAYGQRDAGQPPPQPLANPGTCAGHWDDAVRLFADGSSGRLLDENGHDVRQQNWQLGGGVLRRLEGLGESYGTRLQEEREERQAETRSTSTRLDEIAERLQKLESTTATASQRDAPEVRRMATGCSHYSSRPFGAIVKTRCQEHTLAETVWALQKLMEGRTAPPRWAIVERSPDAGAAKPACL